MGFYRLWTYTALLLVGALVYQTQKVTEIRRFQINEVQQRMTCQNNHVIVLAVK